MDQNDEDENRNGVSHAAPLVVATTQVFRQRVNPHAPIKRKKDVTEQHEPCNSPNLEMRLSEADRVPDAHHSDQVVGAYVRAKDRARHTPPGHPAPGQEKVFRILLLAAGPQTHGHDQSDAGQKNADVQRRQGDPRHALYSVGSSHVSP